jgi:Putative viral replication protein/RNA helicase
MPPPRPHAPSDGPGAKAVPRAVAPLRRRDYCLTFWGDVFPATRLDEHAERIRYCVWQHEVCPTTGRKHIQAYIEFKDPTTVTAVKAILQDDRTHCVIRRWERDAARDYCMKDETRNETMGDDAGPFEWGTWTQQGARNDIYKVRDAIDNGMPLAEVAKKHFDVTCKYPRGVQQYLQLSVMQKGAAKRPTLIRLYYGETGTGKTRAAMREAKLLTGKTAGAVYVLEKASESGQVWWDGYEGQSAVIFDDMYDWVPGNNLLRWLDIYPARLPVKGDFSHLCATDIWLTSNFPLKDWLSSGGKALDPRHVKAIMRRIHVVKYFAEDGSVKVLKDLPRTVLEVSDEDYIEE